MALQADIAKVVSTLARVEDRHDSPSVRALHLALNNAWFNHGHLLGLDENEISTMAGGGTPKTRQT